MPRVLRNILERLFCVALFVVAPRELFLPVAGLLVLAYDEKFGRPKDGQ